MWKNAVRWWWCNIEVQNELDPFKPSKATKKASLLSRQLLAWAAQIGYFYKDMGLVFTFSVYISRKCVVHSNSCQFCSSLKYKILSSITGMSGWVKWVMGWLLTFAPLTGAGAAEYGNTDAAHHPALGHFIWAFRVWHLDMQCELNHIELAGYFQAIHNTHYTPYLNC